MKELLGLLAGSLFAYAAVPQALRTVRAGRHLGTPPEIIFTIFFGTVFMYSYLYWTRGFDWVLAINYAVETISWGVLLGFYLRSRRND